MTHNPDQKIYISDVTLRKVLKGLTFVDLEQIDKLAIALDLPAWTLVRRAELFLEGNEGDDGLGRAAQRGPRNRPV